MQAAKLQLRPGVFDRQARYHGMRLPESLRVHRQAGLRLQREDLRQRLRDEEGRLRREGEHNCQIYRSLW
jgi:hypothetical protein